MKVNKIMPVKSFLTLVIVIGITVSCSKMSNSTSSSSSSPLFESPFSSSYGVDDAEIYAHEEIEWRSKLRAEGRRKRPIP